MLLSQILNISGTEAIFNHFRVEIFPLEVWFDISTWESKEIP